MDQDPSKTKPVQHRKYPARTRGAVLDLALNDWRGPWPAAHRDALAHEGPS